MNYNDLDYSKKLNKVEKRVVGLFALFLIGLLIYGVFFK